MTSHRVPIYVSSSTRLNQGQFSLVWNGVIQATAAVITSKLSESATRGYTALTLCKRGPWLKQVPISVNIFLSREMTGNRKQTVRPSAFTTSWFSGNVMLYGRVYVCSDWLPWPPEVFYRHRFRGIMSILHLLTRAGKSAYITFIGTFIWIFQLCKQRIPPLILPSVI